MRIFFLRILGKTVYSSQFAPLLDNCADPFVVDTEYYWVARSKFGTNDWGAWTDDTHFTVVAHVGGGANSSAFDEFFDSLPSALIFLLLHLLREEISVNLEDL